MILALAPKPDHFGSQVLRGERAYAVRALQQLVPHWRIGRQEHDCPARVTEIRYEDFLYDTQEEISPRACDRVDLQHVALKVFT